MPSNPSTIPIHRKVSGDSSALRLPLQRKLEVGSANDPLESEADAMADHVMRGQSAPTASSSSPEVRRKCACEGAGDSCETCKEDKGKTLQRKAEGSVAPVVAPPIVHEVLRSSGRPLDSATRAFMEPRFETDFSQIRIHSDARAAESASTIGAHAYAVGDDIVFGANQYAPETQNGRRLLVHELAHVVQQGFSPRLIQREADPNAPDAKQGASAIDQIVAALQEPQENGVGNFSAAFNILNGLWMVDMLQTLERLQQRGYFDLLQSNSPEDIPRVRVAIAAVAAKGTPAAGPFATANPAFGSLPEQQQHEVATYIGLPWPLPQAASPPSSGEGLSAGEIAGFVLTGAVVVGAVVLFIAFPGALPVLATVISLGTADVAAATAVETGAAVVVEVASGTAVVGAEAATVVGEATMLETAAATETVAATTTAAGETATATTATTTAAETTATTTTSTATAAKTVAVAAASTTLSSDRGSKRRPNVDTEDDDSSPCRAEATAQRGGNSCHDQFATLVSGSPREWGVETPEGLYADFDGLGAGRTLFEVKTGYDFLLSTSESTRGLRETTIHRFIDQATNQLAIAARCGYTLFWVFNSRAVADVVQGYVEPPVSAIPFPCNDDR